VLSELWVSQLGVIEDLRLVLGPGMTALTGETGAGKTLVVEAVELLVGGRADGLLVRPGAVEAVVEGRFVLPAGQASAGAGVGAGAGGDEGRELVVSRVVPAEGRSRAYVDGRMATVGALAQAGERLVDLHGQHAHQSLLSAAAQRDALDAYVGADRAPRDNARAALRAVEEAMASAGGNAEARERDMALLAFQLNELGAAHLKDANEEEALAVEEDTLAMAVSHRAATATAYEGLIGEDQALDRLGRVVAGLSGRAPVSDLHDRLRGLVAELADAASDLRAAAEALEEDPERLAEVVARRALLRELRRKYGVPGAGLDAVLAFQDRARARLAELQAQEGLAARLAGDHAAAVVELRQAAEKLGDVRRAAAAPLGAAVETELRRLAMPRACFQVLVGGNGGAAGAGGPVPAPALPEGPAQAVPEGERRDLAGDDVTFLLAANPGEPPLPLSRVASGGELARAMLALRLVLLGGTGGDQGPGTLVFDEVDAGIGGEAALAVGRALAELGRRYQVIVVTHLAQVAAYARAHVAVTKAERDGRSVALARPVTGEQRVIELSRMLSGQPNSEIARLHAEELLLSAQ
jgi:DNA repair protein RecN (Recombination protein N)